MKRDPMNPGTGWDLPHTWTDDTDRPLRWTTRAKLLGYGLAFLAAFLLGITAEWWDPFARWPR